MHGGSHDVIVVGLGGMGSAAAYHLARRGQRVLGLERFGPVHDQGSSHGGSRLIRQACFEDPAYVPLAQRSYELWRALESSSGDTLLLDTGGLLLGSPDSPMTDLGARLTALGTRLLGPARPLLDGRTKILVLPDGVLSAVPFESLGVGGESYRPLVADATVRVAPSLRLVLARQRGLRAGGATLLALADPVYAKSPAPGSLTKDELALVARNSRFLDYFTPLPETRTEVQAIARLFPSGSSEILVGDAARESVLKKTDLLRFRHVHLATHGILGGEVPGVGEPALVLGEEPGEDGFLTASEVERLKLDADLTVLSACNTGSGEYFTGEGVMGLSRSFLLAGSRAVVVSLWPVASKATERFMVDLYGHLRTLPTAEALRRAKLDMIERARRSGGPEAHPFFWAPFIVFGG